MQTLTCGTCRYTSRDDKEFRVIGIGDSVLLTSTMDRGRSYALTQHEDFCSVECALQFARTHLMGEGLQEWSKNKTRAGLETAPARSKEG